MSRHTKRGDDNAPTVKNRTQDNTTDAAGVHDSLQRPTGKGASALMPMDNAMEPRNGGEEPQTPHPAYTRSGPSSAKTEVDGSIAEFTAPGSVEVDDEETIYSLLANRIERTGPDTVIAARKTGPGRWDTITAGEFHRNVITSAKGLLALGIDKGDAVSIFSATRYEWGVLDFALAAIGAVAVPIYDTDSASQAQSIIADAEVKMIVVDNQERYERVESVSSSCPSLRHVLMFDSNALGALEGASIGVGDDELARRMDCVHADDCSTIVYTSGSTGAPKGVELTHRNFLSIVRAGYGCISQMLCEDHPRLLLFLPLAHCFARYIQYCSIGSDDGVVGYLPDTASLLPDLRSFRPTYLLGVPRVFEKVFNAASRKAGTGMAGRIFTKAAEAARAWASTIQDRKRPTARQIAEHLAYETCVYRSVRGALGPNIRYVACGGAPLSLDLAYFFAGIGLRMIQGYGLTETAAPFTVTRVDDNLIGTVGQPAPGNSVRISPTGEIQLRGENVFRGYHNLPTATAQAFTRDGWLKTGDLGSLDGEGRLTITGRKKDIIITAGGKNVSPVPLEQEIEKCPIVEHAVVVGDGRPFIGALITLDAPSLRQWLGTIHEPQTLTPEQSANLPQVRDLVQRYVDRANLEVSRAESVRKFVILSTTLSQGNGCLTPSLKVVRPRVNALFAPVINDELYAPRR